MVRFFLFSVAPTELIFNSTKKNLNFYKIIKVKILNTRLIKCKRSEKKITKKLK